MNKKEVLITTIFVLIMTGGFFLNTKFRSASLNQEFVQEQGAKIDWVSPTGHKDEGDHYSAAYRVYDDDVYSGAKTYTYWNNDWCPFLELTHDPIICNRVRYYNYLAISAHYDLVDIDVFYDNQWYDVYYGDFNGEWVEKALPEGSQVVERARIRQHTVGNRRCYFYEFDFGKVEKVSLFPSAIDTIQEQQTAFIGDISLKYLEALILK